MTIPIPSVASSPDVNAPAAALPPAPTVAGANNSVPAREASAGSPKPPLFAVWLAGVSYRRVSHPISHANQPAAATSASTTQSTINPMVSASRGIG